MQMVWSSPDIQEYQRPKVDDRQLVRINRTLCLFGYEIIHHAQEPRRQEKPNRIVSIPPLHHGILHTRKQLHRLRAQYVDGHRQIIHHMQQRNGHNKGQEKPVRHINMPFTTLKKRPHEHGQICQPYNGQPNVDIPFWFCILFGLRRTQQVPCCGQNDKQIVTPENKPGRVTAPQSRWTGSLNYVKWRHNQRIPTKGKNHRRCV